MIGKTTLLVACFATCPHAYGDQSITLGAELSSNYLWRGVSQSNDQVALSLSADYQHDSGFFASGWLSNVDFGEESSASYELDLTFGYYFELSEHISSDISYNYYAFPDETNGSIDLGEVIANLYLGDFTLTYGTLVNAGSSAFSDSQNDTWQYLAANYHVEPKTDWSVDFDIGAFSGDSIKDWYDDDYMHYQVRISHKSLYFTISDTNIEGDELMMVVSYQFDFE